jgi:beta-glucosidase
MKALKQSGKPLVFVMMTGSAVAIPWEDENVPAIVNAWYGGQSAGTAIADVLFGDYNPSGRLPVTFYKSDSDLPDFNNYSMTNRTYRYFKGKPLYGFGYGLSYTTYKYDQLKVPTTVTSKKDVPVSVRVTNAGKMDGEEVVEVYVTNEDKRLQTPIRALKGFQRVFLKAGESKIVNFNLSHEAFGRLTTGNKVNVLPGTYSISVGGSQPDAQTNTAKKTVQTSLKFVGK